MRVCKALYRLYRWVFPADYIDQTPVKVKPMLKNEEYKAALNEILQRYPKCVWTSDGQSRIDVVERNWYQMRHWDREKDGVEESRLHAQGADDTNNKGITELCTLILNQDNLMSVKRPVIDKKNPKAKPTKFELYIMTKFGAWSSVGIRVFLYES